MSERLKMVGIEIRRLRIEAGMSLTQLANKVHYSKGHLSKIETGNKRASIGLVRLCDSVLGADGALVELAAKQPPQTQPEGAAVEDAEVWLMNLAADGANWFRPMDRREALALGTFALAGFGLSTQGMSATSAEPTALGVFQTLFDQFRALGQTASPGVVLPSLIAQTHVLRGLAARAPVEARDDLLTLGARYAEYVGWMAQESGNDQAALWWTARAVEMAEAGNDRDLGVYALVRRALVTLYRQDAPQTVDLARRAQAGRDTPARIRGLAAQREAQGHALAGDYDACRRSLDRAQEWLAADTETAMLGSTNLINSVSMVTGWCLYELGRPKEASEILDREVARIQPHALRSRARYGVRQALAHATAGEIDHACALTGRLLDVIDVVSSATIATDLRRLARVLSRWHTHSSVRGLYPMLTASLRSPEV